MSPEKVAAALGQELGETKTHKDSIDVVPAPRSHDRGMGR